MSASSASSLRTGALAPGTELIVDRLAYRHHGIYLGEGLVIHYADRIRHRHGLIETVPLRSFVGKRRLHLGRRPNHLKRGFRLVLSSKSFAAKCLLRFSFADPTVPAVWESQPVPGRRC
jgi:hypothetical protein